VASNEADTPDPQNRLNARPISRRRRRSRRKPCEGSKCDLFKLSGLRTYLFDHTPVVFDGGSARAICQSLFLYAVRLDHGR